jgi:parallel beta-helix repeat protein
MLFVSISSARTRYVAQAPAGSDGADGSSGAPWATIQHAVDNIAGGDTVIVRAGTYAGFAMGYSGSQDGTLSHPTVIKADSGAILNDKNNRTADCINLEGASYVTIDGFTIKNTKGTITRAGIRAVTDSGVIIRNNIIDSCGTWGILTGFSENIRIENNSTSRAVAQHGIYFSNSADNPIIRGNKSFGNNMCGIHMNGDVSMGGDGVISHALVENNIVWDNGRGGGSGINCDGIQNSRFQNNLLYNNHASEISLYQGDGSGPGKNDTVINNTILEAPDARWCVNIKNGSTGVLLMNNILYNYHSWHGSVSIDAASLTGFASDYNVMMDRLSPDDDATMMTLAQWRTSTKCDSHSVVATPTQLFVNESLSNYHLKAGCAAIDAGTSLNAPSRDLEGRSRPVNTKFDIGAYEYSSAGVVRFLVHRLNDQRCGGVTGVYDFRGRICTAPNTSLQLRIISDNGQSVTGINLK